MKFGALKGWSFSKLSIGFVLLLTSCLLQKADTNFVTINKDGKNGFSDLRYRYTSTYTSYTDFVIIKDTVRMTNTLFIMITGDIKGYKVDINNSPEISYTSAKSEVVIPINRKGRAVGNYKVSITRSVRTNTGSLANKLQVEYSDVVSSFILVIEEPTSVAQITDVAVQDGTIRIKWKPYTGSDFKSYRLDLSSENSFGPYQSYEIKDAKQPYFDDFEYQGAKVFYQITINKLESATSNRYEFQLPFTPSIVSKEFTQTGYTLKFTKPPYFKNVSQYRLVNQMDNHVAHSFDSEVTVENPLPFGASQKVYLQLISNGGRSMKSGPYDIAQGQPIRPFNDIVYDPVRKIYYAFRASPVNVIYRLADKTLSVIDSVKSPFNTTTTDGVIFRSPDGTHFYALSQTEILKFNPDNLNAIERTNFSSLGIAGTGPNFTVLSDNHSVANNNVLAFRSNSSQNDSYVFDMNTKQKIIGFQGDGFLSLSANAEYLCYVDKIYSFTAGAYQLYSTLPYGSIYYTQFPNSSSTKLLIHTVSFAIMYNYINLAPIFGTQAISNSGHHLDQSTDKLFFKGYQGIQYIFDLNSGSTKALNALGSSVLEGGILLSPNGYMLADF